MKSNLLNNVFDWTLATSVLLSLLFLFQFYNRTKDMRSLQGTLQQEMADYQHGVSLMNTILPETAEYNKAHPDAALTRLLDGLKPTAAPAAATKPAAK